ncbi:MAG TPA: 5-amino-6-(D-ribitylamino)uracil--L-tyrosine 4-hydroxyphenyl transferase CofH [Pseudomonadales bacterium]|nr:5-amino-6-(D-ribitylamino)uracil--L-tyrosine 4-hydroxyphenyl transferase CofH [Pseudomonadales bacterium]
MWVVIPVKNLDSCKSRLAHALPDHARPALMGALLADLLDMLHTCQNVTGVAVVTRCAKAANVATKHNADVLALDDDCCLNSGASAAITALAKRNIAEVLILHADLPLVNAADIDTLISTHRSRHAAVTLVPDNQDNGTNAMLLSLPSSMRFFYGQQSYKKHLAFCNNNHFAVQTVHNERIGCDIDLWQDFAPLLSLRTAGNRPQLARWLEQYDDLFDWPLTGTAMHTSNTDYLTDSDCLALADCNDTAGLMARARTLRDNGFYNVITFSKKVFIPLTHLCRDVCHYCTFAQTPKKIDSAYMTIEQVLAVAREGAAMGCKEALFTLGEKPELRYSAARKALDDMGYATTIDYLYTVAEAVYKETGLLPHLNPGTLNAEEMAKLRTVSPSMGIMLESLSTRLCEKGMPHYGSPDKDPAVRLATLEEAGRQNIPFTTGILIGIGETRLERIESLLAIRALHEKYGHIQEIIIQNFRAKPDTKMTQAPEPDLEELLWTLAIARIIFGSGMAIQAPPNLSPGVLEKLVDAGINDWGGVSPLTPDYVNPEAPWPHLQNLADATANAGKFLHERLTIYPAYVRDYKTWSDKNFHTPLLQMTDGDGFPRVDNWQTGSGDEPPMDMLAQIHEPEQNRTQSADIKNILAAIARGESPTESEIVRLFRARGDDVGLICHAADNLRNSLNGDTVTYVVNRNINYTNVCYFKCQFCAFSKGKLSENLRGRPYDISLEEIQRRTSEGWQRGATEVCMQGGIHPDYDGNTYIEILDAVKAEQPDMHIHAFSPLEIWQGAATIKKPLKEYLQLLQDHGLGTLPGTAAEILDDEIRDIICADKIRTAEWLEVMETAHSIGLRSTATIMFGHVEHYQHWARHFLRLLDIQKRTGGFTEFVPLPFVAEEAPMYLKGRARKGPTFREAVLMHAVARLVLSPHIKNIQASWVKLGNRGVQACLSAGVNDLGGTLMNESITRAAGATHGQENSPENLDAMIRSAARHPKHRTTLYGEVEKSHIAQSYNAAELSPLVNNTVERKQRDKRISLVRQIA